MERSLSKRNITLRPLVSAEQGRPGNWASRLFLFAKNFLRQPKKIGWFLPSSRFVVAEVLKKIDWPTARTIVEFGPGLGVFTKEILARMHPDAKLIAFETNDEFFDYLRASLPDPRFHLVHGSAMEVESVLMRFDLAGVDYVISGIPFKTLSEEARCELVRKAHTALQPQGKFLVYQLSDSVRPHLEKVFGKVESGFEWLSLPPNRIFCCAR